MARQEARELGEHELEAVVGGSPIPSENSTIYYVIDASGSMSKAVDTAKRKVAALGGFPDPFVNVT